MGLFQNLLETYERCSASVGIAMVDENGQVNEKKTLLPIFHMTFKSEICITIDQLGNFINAQRDNKETTIIIPCTEESSGRSSGIAPHPLCDQLDYVGGINGKKTETYLSGLNLWKDNFAELNAIYTYVFSETMMGDLLRNYIFKENEYQSSITNTEEKTVDTEKIRKIGVRFVVKINDSFVNVWEDITLRNAWINHMKAAKENNETLFDYMSGSSVVKIASNHPKNINSFSGNAKLISCNDTSNFTFRGRFNKQDDAIIIDLVNSQKTHQMLRWLIANYGYAIDTQVIVTWLLTIIQR